ncbi:MAG: PQQ-binding-like beta-propeller repeat protein [Pseudolysinimonas sp.]|uniref:variant leucine-rich repeat-containing protein n=1 Tax=Pseudolysinimonas sp. TaxID=2680009 RepID=UPI003266C2B2
MNPAVEAADPATDPARLAQIAHQSPELAATVAANPTTYPGLLEWIVQYGDDAAKAAARVRMGISATPPPPPPAGLAPAASLPPASPVTAGAGPHLSPRVFAIGGGALAVVALGVVAALVIPSLIGGGGGPGNITTAEILHEPKLDAWRITNPFDGAGSPDEVVDLNTFEVGQDLAVLSWYSRNSSDYGASETSTNRASLVNTRTGATMWVVDTAGSVVAAVGGVGNGPTVLALSDDQGDNGQLIAIDRNGKQVSATLPNDGYSLYTAGDVTSSFRTRAVMIDGDVLATNGNSLARLSANDLSKAAWSIDEGGGNIAVTPDRVIIGDSAYSLSTGKSVTWKGGSDLYVLPLGQRLIASKQDGDSYDIVGLTTDGDETWSTPLSSTSVIASADVIVTGDPSSGTLTGISMADGSVLWTTNFSQNDGQLYTQYGTDVVWVSSGGDGFTGINARTGVELYRNSDIIQSGSLIGGTRNVVYVSGGSALEAYNPQTGVQLWSLPTPSGADDYYQFALLGGHLVAQHTLDSADTDYSSEVVLEGIG